MPMVVVLAGLCKEDGTPLLSKQFFEMRRARVEEIFRSFSLVLSENTQNTVCENSQLRFLYAPLGGSIHLVLATTLDSNILEDSETLSLLHHLVNELTEDRARELKSQKKMFRLNSEREFVPETPLEKIQATLFELLFGIEEVLCRGRPCKTTAGAVRTALQMESHDEMIEAALLRDKIQEAKEAAKLKMKQQELSKKGVRFGESQITNSSYTKLSEVPEPVVEQRPAAGSKKKALQLDHNERRKAAEIDIHFSIEERLSALLGRDGSVENIVVTGCLRMRIDSHFAEHAEIQLEHTMQGITFQPHANINKELFEEDSLLQLKNPKGKFPFKKDIPVLKWTEEKTSDEDVPLRLTCWVEKKEDSSRDLFELVVEFGLENSAILLEDVSIEIPVPAGSTPTISRCEDNINHDEERGLLVWSVGTINQNRRSGLAEFLCPETSEEAFFPISAFWSSKTVFSQLSVSSAVDTATKQSLMFHQEGFCQANKYLLQ